MDEAAAKPWFLTIIRREYARTFERKRLVTVDVDELIAQRGADACRRARSRILAETARRALFKLPDEYREPLVLQVLMGYLDRRNRPRAGSLRRRRADALVPRAQAAAGCSAARIRVRIRKNDRLHPITDARSWLNRMMRIPH